MKLVTPLTIGYFISYFGFLKVTLTYKLMVLNEGDSPAHLKCNQSESLHVVFVKSLDNDNCKMHNVECNTMIFRNLSDRCNGVSSCNISSDILQGCKSFNRYLTIEYECKYLRWWLNKVKKISTCADSISAYTCNGFRGIRIQSIDLLNPTDKYYEDCIFRRLKTLCNGEYKCNLEKDRTTCLFGKRYVQIGFTCLTENTTYPTNEMDLKTPTSPFANSVSVSLPEVTEPSTSVAVNKDNEGRIFVRYSIDERRYICTTGWDDSAATVACRAYFRSPIGKSKFVTKHINDEKVIHVKFKCKGNETGLEDCDSDGENVTCSSDVVAGVDCCNGESCLVGSSNQEGENTSSGAGIAVGVTLSVLLVLVVIAAFLYFRRRGNLFSIRSKGNSKPNIGNQRDDLDYTGQQGIALPNYSRGSVDNCNVQYISYPDFETNQNHEPSSRSLLYSVASNPSEYDQSTHATSKDGVYDKAHDRRHVGNEANTYGHSVDEMYDTSNQQIRHDEEGDSYGRVVDTVYDATGHNDRQTANIDNSYDPAVDTAYDTAGQIGTVGVRDDIYD